MLVFVVATIGKFAFAVVVSVVVEELREVAHALHERRIVLAVVAPSHLGYGAQARQCHVLRIRVVVDIFGPQVALYAENVFTLLVIKLVVRVECV